MQYTFALIAEKTLEELGCTPLFLHSAPQSSIQDMTAYHHRGGFSPTRMYLIDNTKGTRPLSACEPVRNAIYLPSAAEVSLRADALRADALRADALRADSLGAVFPKTDSPWTESPAPYNTWLQSSGESRSLLVLPPAVPLRQVEKAVMNAFFFYNSWYERILEQIRLGRDWFTLIDLAHELLQNPMLIYDRSMKVLAYTRNDGTTDSLWTDTVSAGTAHTDSVEESLELLKYIRKLDQYQTPFRHAGPGMSDPFYSCNIMAQGKRIGIVTETERNRPATQGHQDLLWNLANLLSLPMQQEDAGKQTAGIAERQLLEDLLAGVIASDSLLTTRLVASHWQVLPFGRILQFAPAIPYISDEQWSQGFHALSALPLHGIGCRIPDGIRFIATFDSPEPSAVILDGIRQVCRKYHFRCGFSDAFSTLLDVHRYKRQPELALSLAKTELCFYEEVRFANLKQHFLSYENPEDLMHPAVNLLRELDASTGSEYLKTLQALFDNQYSQVGAALTLGIHRTTLFYRLQKIEDLTGIHLSNAREMFHIQMSLLMCDID